MAKSDSKTGISLTGVLFIVFLVLKLTGNIDWSWWWVTSPLWLPFGIAIGIGVIILFITLTFALLGRKVDWRIFKKF